MDPDLCSWPPSPFHLGAITKSRKTADEIPVASLGEPCEKTSADISVEETEFAVSTRMSLRNLVRIRRMLSAWKFLENHNGKPLNKTISIFIPNIKSSWVGVTCLHCIQMWAWLFWACKQFSLHSGWSFLWVRKEFAEQMGCVPKATTLNLSRKEFQIIPVPPC